MLCKTTRLSLYPLACVLILSGLPAMPVYAQPVPLGEDFQVNTYTTDYQYLPDVAVAPDGRFVVVWQSKGSVGTDHSSSSVQGQLYSSDGSPEGAQFQVNTYTTSSQSSPAVAMIADDGFVVTWTSSVSPGDDDQFLSIQGQRYAADGSSLGSQFQVNSYTTSFQYSADVAASANGFVVVWTSRGYFDVYTNLTNIQAQLYTADGIPAGDQFQVSVATRDSQSSPSVAVEPDGRFVVVWRDNERLSFNTSIKGRYFATDGTPIGDQFQVNTSANLVLDFPDVAVSSTGGFAAVWQDGIFAGPGGEGIRSDVKVRFFERGGSPLGDDFQANTIVYDVLLKFGAVTAGRSGEFLVVWNSPVPVDGTFVPTIQGQLYAPNGIPLTPGEFQLNANASTRHFHTSPAVAIGADGQLVVTWESRGREPIDGSGSGILARRFRLPVLPITAIPTLGTWGLLALVGVLALLALTRLRGSASTPKRLEPSKES